MSFKTKFLKKIRTLTTSMIFRNKGYFLLLSMFYAQQILILITQKQLSENEISQLSKQYCKMSCNG